MLIIKQDLEFGLEQLKQKEKWWVKKNDYKRIFK